MESAPQFLASTGMFYGNSDLATKLLVREATVQAIRGTVDSSAANVATWTDVKITLNFTSKSTYNPKIKKFNAETQESTDQFHDLQGEVTITAKVMHVIR